MNEQQIQAIYQNIIDILNGADLRAFPARNRVTRTGRPMISVSIASLGDDRTVDSMGRPQRRFINRVRAGVDANGQPVYKWALGKKWDGSATQPTQPTQQTQPVQYAQQNQPAQPQLC